MKFVASYSLKETWRRKGYSFLCLFACFLVSLVTLLSRTLAIQGGIIFLMIAEKEKGEMDIILKPSPLNRSLIESQNSAQNPIESFYIDYAFFNYSKFTEIMELKSDFSRSVVKQSAARILFKGNIKISNINLYLIDSAREKQLEIGRSFPEYELSKGECIVHKKIKRHFENDEVLMYLNVSTLIQNSLLKFYYEEHFNPNITKIESLNTGNIAVPCKIKLVIEENYGKVENNEDTIIMESKYFLEHLSAHIPEPMAILFPDYSTKLRNLNINEYINYLIVNFPPNRITTYIERDFDLLLDTGVKYANSIVQEINSLQHIKISMPLIDKMKMYDMGIMLLNLVINIIIIALFILSLILIYSLLMITTETSSFEYGILRLIGCNKRDLIFIIFCESIAFALPAFLLAFGVHFLLLDVINILIKSFIKSNLKIHFSYESFFISLGITFLAPITASILPIRTILKKNIATSIDTMINKTSGIKIEIISVEKKERTTMIVFGLLTFCYGAAIYYFLPLSMISTNYGMLGMIFLWILIGVIVGLIILSMNLENILQRLVTYGLMFFTRSYTKTLIIKNLTAHRLKNRKTSIMYSLSVGLFIMATVSIEIVLQNLQKQNLIRRGAEVAIEFEDNLYPSTLKETLMKLYENEAITNFGFKTHTLDSSCAEFEYYKGTKSQIVNYGTAFAFKNDVLGIGPSFFNESDIDFLKVANNHKYSNKKFNTFLPCEQLYLKENNRKIGLSGIFTWEFNLNLNDEIYLITSNSLLSKKMTFVTKPAFILNSAGGVEMNNQPSMMTQRTAVINIPTYIDLINRCLTSFRTKTKNIYDVSYVMININSILLRPNKTRNTQNVLNLIADIINTYLDASCYLWFYEKGRSMFDTVSSMINVVFYGVCLIVLFFCFFNITASMTINIFQQKKEIAILRSIGMKSSHIIFVYIGEAIVLILSSSIIGTIIGSLISFTISLQWQILMNVPLTFSMDLWSLLIVIIFSLLGGVLSTILPAMKMMRLEVSKLIKSA